MNEKYNFKIVIILILFFLFHRAIDMYVNPTWPVKIMLKHTWFQPHNQYTSQGMFETVLPFFSSVIFVAVQTLDFESIF